MVVFSTEEKIQETESFLTKLVGDKWFYKHVNIIHVVIISMF